MLIIIWIYAYIDGKSSKLVQDEIVAYTKIIYNAPINT